MKIIALITDDQMPEGRTERYTANQHDTTLADAHTQMERTVKHYNATMRPGDLPRRLLSVQLVESTPEEAFQMGMNAFRAEEVSIEGNFWPAGHPLHAEWRSGYKEAEEQWATADEDDEEDES
jgi:hypothetical protein